ncbi:Uncharacterised protein [Mycobacteroides abscessus]|nr:Uncharacterised protein [Mycobacteroides abscessus]
MPFAARTAPVPVGRPVPGFPGFPGFDEPEPLS